jgi:hypothetical protein
MPLLRYCKVIAPLLLIYSCGKPCFSSNEVHIETVPIMNYFNVYKPSNWWVYSNTDHSKKDSIYVHDFKESITYRAKTCVTDSNRLMKLSSTEFLKNKFPGDLALLIKSTVYKELLIFFTDQYSTVTPLTDARYPFTKDPILSIASYIFLDSIVLNSVTYQKILVLDGHNFDKYYFAENLGLVGWRSNTNSNTTFNLVNYKIN